VEVEVLNKTMKRMLLIGAIALLSAPVGANVDIRLLQQRQMFQDAESALNQGRLSQYHQLEQQLRDYPLHVYLQYNEIKRNLGQNNYKSIHRYLEDYPGTPLATRLQYAWLKSLARQKQWQTLIDNFYYTSDKGLQCDFARALFAVNQNERAFSVLEGIWQTGKSLPDNCDYPIEVWHKAGGLTQVMVWERIRLAMQARNVQLALYLAKYLKTEDQFWVRMWAKVRRDPNFVAQVHDRFKSQDTQQLRWVLADGIRRMSVTDAPSAAQLWYKWRDAFQFSSAEKDRIERRLTLALVKEDPEASKTWLSQLDLDTNHERVNELYVLNAFVDQDWDSAIEWLARFDDKEKQTDRWRYWHARALEGLGRLEESRTVYLLNADSRSYYGFLSADRAGMNYQFDHRPIAYQPAVLSTIEKIPAIERARELYALNRVVDARREWNFALQNLDNPQMLAAAQLASDWNWHDRAIVTLAQAQYWDDLEKRFPLAHRELVMSQARQQRINPAWAFAIIRQESAFSDDARSHAGAIGLMQLLPRTAREMARSLQIRFSRNDLLDASTNVRLGINYLKQVKDKFKGNDLLATAAYNAGDFRVRQWLPKDGIIPADIWVESVPFAETRDYLQRVMTYTVIYEQRLGQHPVPLLDRMLPVSNSTATMSDKTDV